MAGKHVANVDTWIIGDQGYPLEPWLMIPYANPVTPSQKKFNKLQIKSRNVVERAFGILKSRFRCLSKDRVLFYSHERAAQIVNACIILNNLLLNTPEPEEHDILDQMDEYDEINSTENSILIQAERIRSRYANTL